MRRGTGRTTKWAMVALAAAVGCDASEPADDTVDISSEIINGTTVTRNDAGAVAIFVDGSFRCSGTYMGGKWVITARHCTEVPGSANLRFPINAYWITGLLNPGTTVPASAPSGSFSTVTAFYDYAFTVDIALLKLTNPLSPTYVTPPAGRSNPLAIGQTLLCQGYGAFNKANTGAGRLRKAWMTINGLGVHSPDETTSRTDWPYQVRYGRNSSSQIQFFGDSGGPCFVPVSTPGGGVPTLATVHRTGYPSVVGTTPNNSFGVAVTTGTPWYDWIGTHLQTP